MKRPIVTFIVKDSNREAEYICFLAKILTSREHQKAGFLVLPEPLKDNIYSFCFPDLKYSERFWAAITNTKNKHLGQSFPDEAVHEVIEKISPFETEKNVALKNKIIKDWKGIEDKFFKIYSDFIDVNNTLSKVSSIEVLLTEYGSLGSFYPAKFGSDYKILITKRIDLPADSLIRTILQATIAIKTNIS